MEQIKSIESYPQFKDKTFVIGSVRNASEELIEKYDRFVEYLETREEPVKVHLPNRDTIQTNTGLEICTQNTEAIADPEVSVVAAFYDETSKGSHFDYATTLENNKGIFVVEYMTKGGWFAELLEEWQEKGLPEESPKGEEDMVQEDTIFLIADIDEYTPQWEISRIRNYVDRLENNGLKVYWPYMNRPEGVSKLEEALEYREAMRMAENVHVFYRDTNMTRFLLGLGFGAKKSLTVVENEEYGPGKSFPRMIDEWAGNI